MACIIVSTSATLDLDCAGNLATASFNYELKTSQKGVTEVDFLADPLVMEVAVSTGCRIAGFHRLDNGKVAVRAKLTTPLVPGAVRCVEFELGRRSITPSQLVCFMAPETVSASVTVSYPASLDMQNLHAICGSELVRCRDWPGDIGSLDPDNPYNDDTLFANVVIGEGGQACKDAVGLAWSLTSK